MLDLRVFRDRSLVKYPSQPVLLVPRLTPNIVVNTFFITGPRGSGKTVGVAMALYHSAMSSDSYDVVVVRVRELLRRGKSKVLAGSLADNIVIGAVRVAGVLDELCYDPSDRSCYSTVSRGRLAELAEAAAEGDAWSVARVARPDRPLIVVVDDAHLLPVDLASSVVRTLSEMASLHRAGHRELVGVILADYEPVKSAWPRIVAAAVEAGEASALRIAYYRPHVYAHYVRRALELVAQVATDGSVRERAERLLSQLEQPVTTMERLARAFQFLERVPPPIAFDMLDGIVALMVRTSTDNIVMTAKEAVKRASKQWMTTGDVLGHYSAIAQGRTALHTLGRERLRLAVEQLARDLYTAIHNTSPQTVRSTSYHSTLIAAAGSTGGEGTLVILKASGSAPPPTYARNLTRHARALLKAAGLARARELIGLAPASAASQAHILVHTAMLRTARELGATTLYYTTLSESDLVLLAGARETTISKYTPYISSYYRLLVATLAENIHAESQGVLREKVWMHEGKQEVTTD